MTICVWVRMGVRVCANVCAYVTSDCVFPFCNRDVS